MKNFYNFQTGDQLSRSKDWNTTHYGIYIGYINGVHVVAENNTPSGVRQISLSEFAQGRDIEVTPFTGNEYQRSLIVPYVQSLLGTSYSLLHYNCEHFVNHILKGKPFSRQVQNVAVVGILGFVLWSIFGSKEKKR
ncbi:MAG: hypothetical protein RL757_1577 [Bacteroidota bacterium]|jgi:hypothetical protein